MKSVKRHLSLICVVALVLAIMVPTVFAATTGYNYTYPVMLHCPIFNDQIRNTRKLPDVVCDQDHIFRSGVRGDQHI